MLAASTGHRCLASELPVFGLRYEDSAQHVAIRYKYFFIKYSYTYSNLFMLFIDMGQGDWKTPAFKQSNGGQTKYSAAFSNFPYIFLSIKTVFNPGRLRVTLTHCFTYQVISPCTYPTN